MKISQIISVLEKKAPLAYQESYDNAGLITGNKNMDCSGILCTLDVTEDIIQEAIQQKCNLIVAHHPIVFKGLSKINGKNYVERIVIQAIKNDIAIYAIHTNLDNVSDGVNSTIAEQLGLINTRILSPQKNGLLKLVSFVPLDFAEKVKNALFEAGAGNIGEYSETSFSSEGIGSFKGSQKANPVIGQKGIRELVKEIRIEVILPTYLQSSVLMALKEAHPYEEVAYDFFPLNNENQLVGTGMIGDLPIAIASTELLELLKAKFNLSVIKHSAIIKEKVQKIAFCGGSGSFLIPFAKAAKADFFVSADIKYHDFFEADNQIVIADIGHWESEQYTVDLVFAELTAKFPNFAVLKTANMTNPVRYFLG
ncbi:MAG: Nif3-like dinuclear metal center hexameric protein [Sphingobacteriia bacterium]